MKVLYLTSRLPWPPDRGDRVRTWNFLREIAGRHEVSLLSTVATAAEAGGAERIARLGVRVRTVLVPRLESLMNMAAALPSHRPFQVAYYRSRRMAALVAEWAIDRDVVVAHLIRTAPYLSHVPSSARRVVDLCDCISSEYVASLPHRRGVAKLFYAREAERVAAYERAVLDRVDEAWVISEAEAAKLGHHASLRVVSNGVSVPVDRPPRDREGTAVRLLFTGNLSVPHNVDTARHLVRDVLPLVRRELPAATLTLGGADPVAGVRALAGPAVTVTGWVDDLGALLAEADVFVAPMRYVAGVQNKVLEAMACGRPVVTTEAVRLGIGAEDGTHLLVGRDAAETAGHVVRLARDEGLAGRIGTAGRELVRHRFSWSAVLERLEALEREPVP